MQSTQLEHFPKLKTALSPNYLEELNQYFSNNKKTANAYINIYSLFIQLVIQKDRKAYTGIDIRNSEEKLREHILALIGFLYSDTVQLSNRTIYDYSRSYISIFNLLAVENNINLAKITLFYNRMSEDAELGIKVFNRLGIDQSGLDYYAGWTVFDKEGKNHFLHLARFRDAFGTELTSVVFEGITDYLITQKHSTAGLIKREIVSFLNAFVDICSNKAELQRMMQPESFNYLMEKVLQNRLVESIINQNDPEHFFKAWRASIKYFNECFIDKGIFEEPIRPFLTPVFKKPKDSSQTFSIGGNFNEGEENRWLIDIPLEINDDSVLKIIQRRLEKDLEHIRIIAHQHFNEIKEKQERNDRFIKTGLIKPIPVDGRNVKKVPVGIDNLENTVSTFYNNGFGATSNYQNFLGFSGNTIQLNRELNLPCIASNNFLIYLLILEHPSITISWLEKWELYDKNGNRVGFKQVGELWIALSYKDRRGSKSAQQEVVLTKYSKSIIELIIQQSKFTRDALKAKGGTHWRYMFLNASHLKAERSENLSSGFFYKHKYHRTIGSASYEQNITRVPVKVRSCTFSKIQKIHFPAVNQVLSKSEAIALSKLVSPKSLRKARGLQIYLETFSLRAVSQALGHKVINMNLLGLYLPKPLMDYFNERWIRQFQNAIIYKALKDSPYLFDALDFHESQLEEFLHEHGLKSLPGNLTYAKEASINEDYQSNITNIDSLVFTLSTQLFQVLIAIKSIVENASQNDLFKPIVDTWYEAATFILSYFSLNGRHYKDAQSLYENALRKPLDIMKFKSNLLCR